MFGLIEQRQNLNFEKTVLDVTCNQKGKNHLHGILQNKVNK